MANTVLLVGDGFNRFVAGCYPESGVAAAIRATSDLWGHFQDTLLPLVQAAPGPVQDDIANHSRNTERSAQLLYDMIEFAEGMVVLNRSKDLQSAMNLTCGTVCRQSLDRQMKDTMFKVVKEFIQDETDGLYGNLLRVKPPGLTDLQNLMAPLAGNLAVYTTNYDGIIDMVLGFEPSQNRQGRFSLTDGFGSLPDGTKGVFFREDPGEWTQQWGIRAHLHGSYKFLAQPVFGHGTLYKKLNRQDFGSFDALSEDGQPVVVFDAPDRKLSRIDRFRVLREYLNSFEWHLGQAQNLVLFGISLENDPHLAQRIRSRWLGPHSGPADRKLCIIDTAPDNVLARLDEQAAAENGSRRNYRLCPVVPEADWTFDDIKATLSPLLGQ